jgi:AcrR family transcriptional regulator
VAPVTERGVKTRMALVKAARALFEKKGYLDTNVGDISRRARVAHGTFYTYFSSKEEIFAEVADALVEDVQRIADAEPHLPADSTLADRIERSNRGYVRAYQQNARMMAVLEQVATFNPRLAAVRRAARRFWVQRNSDAIRRWQKQGLVDPELDAQYAASALGSMIDRSAYVWIVLQEPYEFDTAVEQLTRLYCNALRVPYRITAIDSGHPDDAAQTASQPSRGS